ncbi:hypothetical protein BBJ28_00019233 [Nothophytophthora sp. Chile5]|nr:hypothetical protein BBJ28_00019233 [Nothophytophthora sp. Chile5]
MTGKTLHKAMDRGRAAEITIEQLSSEFERIVIHREGSPDSGEAEEAAVENVEEEADQLAREDAQTGDQDTTDDTTHDTEGGVPRSSDYREEGGEVSEDFLGDEEMTENDGPEWPNWDGLVPGDQMIGHRRPRDEAQEEQEALSDDPVQPRKRRAGLREVRAPDYRLGDDFVVYAAFMAAAKPANDGGGGHMWRVVQQK